MAADSLAMQWSILSFQYRDINDKENTNISLCFTWVQHNNKNVNFIFALHINYVNRLYL